MVNSEHSWEADTLGHSLRWTRGLVSQLVNEAGVEDVTQDVWLAAIRRRSTTWPPSRSWLAGTARRLSARWWRRASRGAVPDGEQALDLDSVADSLDSAELVERTEQYQRIAQQVLALREPLRSTVLLRFQEGLDVKAIATSQGIGEDTVRWRLRRGLEELRLQLDHERGPGWQAGLVALIDWQPREPLGLGATAPGAAKLVISFGGVLLSLKVIVAAVIATSIAAGFWIRSGNEPGPGAKSASPITLNISADEPGQVSLSGATPGASSRTPVGSLVSSQGSQTPEVTSAQALASCTLIGHVVDSQQQPLAGVAVAFDYPEGLPSATTNSDGDFRLVLDQIPKGDLGLLVTPDLHHLVAQIDFAFEGSAQIGQAPLTLQPGTVDLGTLVLGPAGAVQGRVLGPGRKGLAPSRIRADPGIGNNMDLEILDEHGHFEIGHLPPGLVELDAMKEGYRTVTKQLDVSASVTIHQEFVLEVGPTISGMVVDQAGRPLPGVVGYKFMAGSRESPVACGDDGRFSFGFSHDRPTRLKFSKPGWETVEPLRGRVTPGTRELVVVMAPLPKIVFHVVDANTGVALVPYDLEVYLHKGVDGDSARADWNLYGIDEQSGLAGPHQDFGRELVDAVMAGADGYPAIYKTIRFDEGAPGVMTIALKPLMFHQGRVTWQGNPVAGARVELSRQRALYFYEFIEHQGRVTSAPSDQRRAELAKAHSAGDRGMAGATLHMLDPSDRVYRLGMDGGMVVFTDADGEFEMEDWTNAGPYSLQVTPPSSRAGPGPIWMESVIMKSEVPTDFGEIELPMATAISGWVQSTGQEPLEGHQLWMPGAMPSSVTTDAQGYFKFFRVPPGNRVLTLELSDEIDSGPNSDFTFEVFEGVDRELVLPMGLSD